MHGIEIRQFTHSVEIKRETPFCTRKRSETYIYVTLHAEHVPNFMNIMIISPLLEGKLISEWNVRHQKVACRQAPFYDRTNYWNLIKCLAA